MVPNDIDIITQAASEISRAMRLISSAQSRLNNVLTSGNPKTDYEVADINSALNSLKGGMLELSKIKLGG
jgi:hypothetical protein